MSKKRVQKKQQKGLSNPYSWIGISLAVVALIAVAVVLGNRPQSPSAAETLPRFVDVHSAYQLQQEGAFILDVRQPEEWIDYHAPDTTLIPLNQLSGRLDEVPRDRDIVVVCRSGNRSQEARDILLAAGFESVTSVNGGLLDWREAGYPTVSGE